MVHIFHYHPEYKGTEEEWIHAYIDGTLNYTPENLSDGLVFAEVSGLGYIIYDYIGNDYDVIIPKTYKGKDVVAIASNAFKDAYIGVIEIPNTIINIGIDAFANAKINTIKYKAYDDG